MSTMDIVWRVLVGVGLVLANAFFVSTEFSMTRLPQLKRDDDNDSAGVKKGWEMVDTLEINLTGCQVGISLTTILLGVITEPAVTEAFSPLFAGLGLSEGTRSVVSVGVTILVLNLIHKIWGEQAPTYLGVERPRQVLTYFAIPFHWWVKLTYPLIIFGDSLAKWTLRLMGVEVTRSWTEKATGEADEDGVGPRTELRRQLAGLLQEGGLPRDRRKEVVKSLDIERIPVREAMVARDQIVALKVGESFEEALDTIRSRPRARYPLVEGDLDHYRGGLYTPELMANVTRLQSGELSLEDLARSRFTVDPELSVSDFIDRCQQENEEIALVAEGDRTVGLITLTDALEMIVGQVEDPIDVEFAS